MKLPQLSLRELFLLVVIAAMGFGWWVDRGLQSRHYKELIRGIENYSEALVQMDGETGLAYLTSDGSISLYHPEQRLKP